MPGVSWASRSDGSHQYPCQIIDDVLELEKLNLVTAFDSVGGKYSALAFVFSLGSLPSSDVVLSP